MHHCIGFGRGLLRPANPYPYEFDMNYIITLLKKQRGICSHKYMHV